MTTWNPRANDLFLKALELHVPGARKEYLDGVCAGDAALRAEVEGLLDAGARAGNFLESPAPQPLLATVEEPPLSEHSGTVIGPYKLLEQIGEGGFGVVFLAEQQQPVRRKVALKVLKPGMDTRQVVARFEAERQALALMDHPNIARVLDGGQTTSGRPYFVMDLVKGLPITAYCDQARLTPRERLELFVHLCQAVQHAHQKGIIHRDLKPSNVLVTFQDGTPLVKVIDFGIAKALGQQLTDKTLFTGFAQMIGTPLYMAPEQAALSNVDVDTRSDIYSLGVLLYELLTGTTPFERERLKEMGYDELRRIIREEEPPRPSLRISTLGEAATPLSAQRQSDPKRLSQLCRGELDWIVMKALEKDRGRRYETASAFAADVQRYLNDEPVLACPPSAGYCLRKFLRRHRGPVLAAALVLLSLVGGIVGTTVGLLQAQASAEAERRARRGEAEQRGKAATAEAELKLSRLQRNQKIALLQMAVERQQVEVVYRTSQLNRMKWLGQHAAISRLELEDARQRLALEEAKLTVLQTELVYLQELALREDLPGHGQRDPQASLGHVAAGYELAKRWADAADVYTTLASIQRRRGQAGGPELAATRARLARCLLRQTKYTEVEALLRDGLRDRKKEQADDWLLDDARSLLGEALLGQRKYAEAKPLLLKGYEGMQQREATVPAAEKVRLAEALERLARLYDAIGQHRQADIWRRKLVEATVPRTKPAP
jgi:serine/threonine protein kinase